MLLAGGGQSRSTASERQGSPGNKGDEYKNQSTPLTRQPLDRTPWPRIPSSPCLLSHRTLRVRLLFPALSLGHAQHSSSRRLLPAGKISHQERTESYKLVKMSHALHLFDIVEDACRIREIDNYSSCLGLSISSLCYCLRLDQTDKCRQVE